MMTSKVLFLVMVVFLSTCHCSGWWRITVQPTRRLTIKPMIVVTTPRSLITRPIEKTYSLPRIIEWSGWMKEIPYENPVRRLSRSRREITCNDVLNDIVTRNEWNAVNRSLVQQFHGIPTKVILQQTGSNTCNVMGLSGSDCEQCLQDKKCVKKLIWALHRDDMSSGLDDIAYNLLIGQDGVVYEGRGWGVVGQHTAGHDDVSIGIALVGDFTRSTPSQALRMALSNLKTCGEAKGKLAPESELLVKPGIAGMSK